MNIMRHEEEANCSPTSTNLPSRTTYNAHTKKCTVFTASRQPDIAHPEEPTSGNHPMAAGVWRR